MAGEFWLFLTSVGDHWWAIVGGGVVSVVIMIVERRRKRDFPWTWLVSIMAVALLISCFQAWRDVYQQLGDERATSGQLKTQVARQEKEGTALRADMEAKRDQVSRLTVELSRRPTSPKVQIVAAPVRDPEPPPVRALRFTQESVPSDNKDAPHAIQVTIQTNVTTLPTSLIVSCDAALIAGQFRLSGVTMTVGMYEGYTRDRKGYWIGIKETPFKPETPIVVTLTAKHPIHVRSVEAGPPIP